MHLETVTVSAEGQVTIPAEIMKELSIKAGSELIAFTYRDNVMLKVIHMPDEYDLSKEFDEAQAWAKEAGYTEDDVPRIIKEVRQKRREHEYSC